MRRPALLDYTGVLLCLMLARPGGAAALTLEESMETALRHTARARVLRGNVEVAEQKYLAKRINFYVPALSLNGALPSYDVDESYRFFGGSSRKRLYKTRGLGLNSFFQLSQALLTGGNLEVTANLTASNDRYPDTDPTAPLDSFLDEETRRGFFNIAIDQPILKPSTPKNELAERRDDLSMSRLERRQAEGALAKEVLTAYFGVLQAAVQVDRAAADLERGRLTAQTDSMKWQDGVISEEEWLASSSAALDAELSHREAIAVRAERGRELALLLDSDPGDLASLEEPSAGGHPSRRELDALMGIWEESLPVRLAELQRERAQRAAAFAASGHGLTGDFRASYSVGRGTVRFEDQPDDEIRTSGWGVSFNVSYPIWDGGAARASVKAARFEAEQSRLELARVRQTARADLIRLRDQVDVSFRRLEILQKQIQLAEDRLRIAEERYGDGRISRVTLLENQAAVLEARDRYLEELKTYRSHRLDLEYSFQEGGAVAAREGTTP